MSPSPPLFGLDGRLISGQSEVPAKPPVQAPSPVITVPSEAPLSRPEILEVRVPEQRKSGVGPTVGIIIILVLLIVGGLYFWGAHLNRQAEQLPFIPEQNSTSATQ